MECKGDWYTSLKTCFVVTYMTSSLYGDELQGDEYTRLPRAKQQSYNHDYSRTDCKYVAVSLKQVACTGGLPLLKVAITNQHYIAEVKG